MVKKELGHLKKVEIREVWETEAGDFTPWLAEKENIALLGDTIGIDLAVEAIEKPVGLFSADILCKDTANDTWVLIENQLERTDHTHLGQLMTYAAGLDAVTIVWVAASFAEEHRAAIDWLNEITDQDINFFGLEIELWKIGDALPAPKFNVVCKPNEWTHTVKDPRGPLTETQQLQLEFWTKFKEYLDTVKISFKPTKPFPQHWMNHAIGRTGFTLSSVASLYDSETNAYTGEIRAELYIYDASKYYTGLEKQRGPIEQQLGEPLTWLNPENKKGARVYLRKPIDITKRELWPECHAWLREKLEKLYCVLGPIVKQLEPEPSETTREEG